MLRAVFAQILAADRFIAGFSVPAAEPAAFIAEKFYFVLLSLRSMYLTYQKPCLAGNPAQHNGNLFS